MTQDRALEILKSDSNVFLTGQPGTGKTYTINKYIEWCLDNGVVPTVTASTGIAAVHVGGSTLHSFAGVRDDSKLTHENIEDILSNSWTRDRLCRTEVLIIDEISMVSSALLEAVDTLAKAARNDLRPFGGIKLIMVGDFFQLPPVKGDFAFESDVFNLDNLKVCYLHEQYRQNDKVFNDILTGIRAGELTAEQKEVIRGRVVADVSGIKATRLDTHNDKVNKINQAKLERLEGKPETYNMESTGNQSAVAGLIKNCLSPEKLILKVGAPVLFTKNDLELRWVNGTQGTVTKLYDHGIQVTLKDGTEVDVHPADWERSEGYGKRKKTIASISQIPVKLAWAITIHKSQGMTLDDAIIDVSHVFACGHAYVAVSRVRSLEGVYFQGRLTKGFLSVDPKVQEIDKKFLELGM